MAIDFRCEGCGKRFAVKDEMAGKKGKCAACGSPIQIPDLPPPPTIHPIQVEEFDNDFQFPDLAMSRPDRVADLLSEADPGLRERDEVEEFHDVASNPAPTRGYVYKMVQIPPNIQVKEGTSTQGRAAAYLEEVVNRYAMEGWDFFRVDEIGVWVNPGCLSALFGGRSERVGYYVVTFRRPLGS